MGTKKMTKAQMEHEIARLRGALTQAMWDLLKIQDRAATEGGPWSEGFAKSAANEVLRALEVA